MEKPNALDRRHFLKAGSLAGLGSLFLPAALQAAEAPPGGGECEPTTDDILGPYYLPGSPSTTQVASVDEPGQRLFLSGTVLANDCTTPIANAMIEVWQANEAAVYDSSPAFNLRGTMYSDDAGHYAFETILPGAYLNGAQYRPKHIHYRVTRPGYPTLITQLYFEGDPYIAADPWASQPDAEHRIIPLNSIGGDQLEGVFDIVLDGLATGIKPNRYGTDGDLLPPYPNPSAELTSIHFNVFRAASVQVSITDMAGREVRTLVAERMVQGRYTVQWDGLNDNGSRSVPGTYIACLRMDGLVVKSHRVLRR
ncbi:MAG TPA: FlgD immunoglobulin-like domain containing protein [Flavobacteriales bacterium]